MLIVTVEWENIFSSIYREQISVYTKLEKRLWRNIKRQFTIKDDRIVASVVRLRAGYYQIKYDYYEHSESAGQLLQSIKNRIEQQIQMNGERYYIRVYLGAYQYDYDSDNRVEYIRSEIALKFAKTEGIHRVFLYEQETILQLERKLLVEGVMKEAIFDEQFTLDFQPIYQIQNKQLIGFEALLRWEHSIHGKVSPVEFISVAENSGLIIPLGAWVIAEACKQMSRVNSYLPSANLKISINLSPLQLYNEEIVEIACHYSAKYGISRHLIQLELTECTMHLVDKRIVKTINNLRQAGFMIAIDDFGIGYSSLESLSTLPVQCVKLDQLFIRHMEHDERHYAIVKNVIVLAKEIQVEVVAEGVETITQQQLLEELGCLLAQGNYFSRPIATEKLDRASLMELLAIP